VTRQPWTLAAREDKTDLLVGGLPTPGPPDVRPSVGTANVRPFVGRARELAQLISALEAARSGHGSLILVTGEPGVGKSRLMDELADATRERGCRVLIGRCWDGGGAPAYWPWVQVVRAAGGDFESLASASERNREGRFPVSDAVDPAAARFRLFDEIVRFLTERTRTAPALIVLEDVHAADDPSLLLLRFLATSVRDQRILVAASYREAEPRVRDAPELFAELSRLGRHVPLIGFSRSEIGRYIEIATDAVAPLSLVERVYELTAGNPFFVGQVVRARADQGETNDTHALPEEVRALIRRRVSNLSSEASQMLHVAAVVGREFDLRILAETTTLSTERLIDVLGEAHDAGILLNDPATPGSYEFAHDLLREAMYEGLSPTRRMELHRTVGHTLERVFEADLDRHLSALAHHFTQSAPLGDADVAVEYALRAGARAARLLAYEDAASQYERALQLDVPSAESRERRGEILLRLGDAHARSANAAGAKTAYEEAAEIARRAENPEMLARAAFGHATSLEPVRLGFAGNLLTAMLEGRESIALLQEALDVLPGDDGSLRAKVLARLATAMYPTSQAEERLALANEALAMALRLGDPETLVAALHAQHWATLSPEAVRDRLGNADHMLLVATGAGQLEAAFLARHARLHCLLELCDAAGVGAEITAMEQLSAAIRQPFYAWHIRCLRAIQTLMRGDVAAAEREFHGAYESGRPRTSEYVTYIFEHAQIFGVRWTQGRLDELRARTLEHGDRYTHVARWRDALLAAEAGDEAAARAEIERHARNGFEDLPREGLWLLHLSALAQACVLVGDRDRAASLYDLLRPFDDRNAISISTLPFGPVAMRLGMLAGLLERWDAVDSHFERALELSDRLGARAIRAHVLFQYGRVLLARGGASDRVRAFEHLDEAASISQDHQLKGLARGVSDVRDSAEPTPSPPTPEAVFRREGQFWTIAYGGRTARLRDLRGFRYVADLLGAPGREFHALDLLSAHTSADSADPAAKEIDASTWTSPDPVLDARAKQEYRRRLDDLAEELEEARSWHDPERVSRLEAEVEAITDELRRAVGLGGRDREMLSPAERARVSVTKAIKAAVRVIAKECPPLGEHLRASIRTGGYCSYAPPGQQPPRWIL
jgi:tetratricopeptide (TPR) repeat protein